MAAPTNWYGNNFEKSRNPRIRPAPFRQNQPFENPQSKQYSPRMPQQQQQTFKQFNPRFPPPGSVPQQSGRPSFVQGNNMVQTRFKNIPPHQLGNEYSKSLTSKDDESVSTFSAQNPALFQTAPQHIGAGRFEHHSQSGHNQLYHQPFNDQQSSMQNFNSANFQHDRNSIFQQNTNPIQTANVQKLTTFKTMEDKQAQEDKRWLHDWIQHRHNKTEDTLKKTPMKICEAQEKTRQMIVLLARLQKNKQILETVKHEDRSIWEQKLKEVLSIKSELESVQKELTSEENVKHLQSKITQRKKKR